MNMIYKNIYQIQIFFRKMVKILVIIQLLISLAMVISACASFGGTLGQKLCRSAKIPPKYDHCECTGDKSCFCLKMRHEITCKIYKF